MTKTAIQALAILMGVALVALVGFTFVAAGGPDDGETGKSDKSFMQRLHSMAGNLHGGGHGHHGGEAGGEFWGHMHGLVDQLDLSQEQTAYLESIHRTMESHGGMEHGSMEELHDQLIEQFERGRIEDDALRQMVDQHIEQIRGMAYSITDDLVALVNSLDAEQREIVLAHLQGDHAGHGSHHGH